MLRFEAILGMQYSKYENKALLAQVVADSYSLGECLRRLGLTSSGNIRIKLRAAIAENNLSTEHFRPNGRSFEVKAASAKKLEEHLVIGSIISSADLKKKIWAEGLLPRQCQECEQGEVWNGKALVLQLDHINGNRRDNRLGNLRILCPNCHTQTHNFAGRALKKSKPSGEKRGRVKFGPGQAQYKHPDKIEWPGNNELSNLVWTYPLSKLSAMLGVSDNAIKKRCKKLGLALPPFGHWQREAAKKVA